MTYKQIESALREHALAYPETHEDHPWGEIAIKVKGKTFLFMRATESGVSLSVKLPHSCDRALAFAFAEPTGYGLGKSGWVTARFDPDETPPIETLIEWIDESFRAVAPKRLIARMDAK